MQPFRMFGPSLLISLIMTMSIGATSASAESTALCDTDQTPCPSGHLLSHVHEATLTEEKAGLLTALQYNHIYHVHEATLPGQKATLLSSLINVKCDALFLGNLLPLREDLSGNFTYTNCEGGGGSCTVSETSKQATLTLEKLGHEFAGVAYEFEIYVSCGSFIDCSYNGEGLSGTDLGPLLASEENGAISIESQAIKKIGGFLCPKTTKLDILTTPLETTYIAGEGEIPELCSEDPGAGEHEVCPGEAVKIECDALFLGDALELGAPLVIHGKFTYSNCDSNCTATQVSSSALISVLKSGVENAEVTGTGEVLVECSGFIHCVYNGTGLNGLGLGALKNGLVTISKQTTNKVSGLLCPKTATLDIVLSSLSPTYITS